MLLTLFYKVRVKLQCNVLLDAASEWSTKTSSQVKLLRNTRWMVVNIVSLLWIKIPPRDKWSRRKSPSLQFHWVTANITRTKMFVIGSFGYGQWHYHYHTNNIRVFDGDWLSRPSTQRLPEDIQLLPIMQSCTLVVAVSWWVQN